MIYWHHCPKCKKDYLCSVSYCRRQLHDKLVTDYLCHKCRRNKKEVSVKAKLSIKDEIAIARQVVKDEIEAHKKGDIT